MEELIRDILFLLKKGIINEDTAAKGLLSMLDVKVSLPIEFAEWIGINYEHDNGAVIGNVYYDRETRKDYTIPELWDIFVQEDDNEEYN